MATPVRCNFAQQRVLCLRARIVALSLSVFAAVRILVHLELGYPSGIVARRLRRKALLLFRLRRHAARSFDPRRAILDRRAVSNALNVGGQARNRVLRFDVISFAHIKGWFH